LGGRGPIPKSAETRAREGCAAHRPLPPPRPSMVFGVPDRPKGMPAAAGRFWRFYVEQMAAHGTLRPIDAPCLEMICALHADLQQLEREKRKLIRQRKQQAKEEGRQILGGALLEFEMTKEARRLESTINSKRSHLKQLCDRYGLNPMSGSRLQSADFTPTRPVMPDGMTNEPVSEIEARIQ
jgi:phage terminase small subunit